MGLWWKVLEDPRIRLFLVGVPVVATALFGWAYVRHQFLRKQMAPLATAFDRGSVEWQHSWSGITSRISGIFGGREALVAAEVGRFFSVSVGAECASGPTVLIGRLTVLGHLNLLLTRGKAFELPGFGDFWVAGPDKDAFMHEIQASPDLQGSLGGLFAGAGPTFLDLRPHLVLARFNRRAKRLLEPHAMVVALRKVTDVAATIESRAWKSANAPPIRLNRPVSVPAASSRA